MEMTIEESLEWLISRKEHYEMDDNCQELAQALKLAIDIMYKYQKIEQLLKAPCIMPEGCYSVLNKIQMVVKEDKE